MFFVDSTYINDFLFVRIQAIVTEEDGMDSIAHRFLSAAVKVLCNLLLLIYKYGLRVSHLNWKVGSSLKAGSACLESVCQYIYVHVL